jgi:hypothetical protein
MTLDYFDMSHASSVFPTVVFGYNDKSRRYLPANKKFSSYLLGGIEDDLRRLESARANLDPKAVAPHEQYLSAVLGVFLDKVYAGREADGQRFFNMEYRLSDRHEIKSDIQTAFRSDPIYRSIYVRESIVRESQFSRRNYEVYVDVERFIDGSNTTLGHYLKKMKLDQ